MKPFPLLMSAAFVLSIATPSLSAAPDVRDDGRVAFRIAAPSAKEVTVNCETLPATKLTRTGGGEWEVTLGPLAPDFYSYSFVVDGLRVLDPRNPRQKRNLIESDSLLHVPGPASLPWESADVPRGVLHRHTFRSAVAGEDREFLVYTPPGYEPKDSAAFPVLYLLHGFSDDADTWSTVGRANVILDNLIARGAARPMLVVMPFGYGDRRVLDGGWTGPARGKFWNENLLRFRELLLAEIVPQVERNYRIAPGRENRAIAGLSMGGVQALLTGLNHLDRFAWIGAFSAGHRTIDFADAYPALLAPVPAERQPRLLWLACGEQDERLGINRQRAEWFAAHGLAVTWKSTPGTHSFLVWRRYLAEFAPRLFRDAPAK